MLAGEEVCHDVSEYLETSLLGWRETGKYRFLDGE
jgi:hypothetical protein